MKTILLDVDGTLYKFDTPKFKGSWLQKQIKANALSFIQDRLNVDIGEAKEKLADIENQYGEDISLGLEEMYNISRKEYFEHAWDINANEYIKPDKILQEVLRKMSKTHSLIVVSDAPKIWTTRVLDALNVSELIDHIETGEGDCRKSNMKMLPALIRKYNLNVQSSTFVGDQETSDIIPAQNIGMRTILVGTEGTADHIIPSIHHLDSVIMENERPKRLQIGVMGSAGDLEYSQEIEQIAEKIGSEIASRGHITVYGAERDYDSLSTAAARGAKSSGGLTVGITYGKGGGIFDQENTDVLIRTGIDRGGGREFVLVNTCDAIICVSGGSGTLTEIAIAYQSNIPIVCVAGSGGWSDKLADTFLDARKRMKCLRANSPEEAVQLAIAEVERQ